MALLELRNVSKIYHLGGEEIRALDDVSLDLDQGEFVSIIGPSGSGKSTLMHILGCLDSPTRGNVVLGGIDIAQASARELARVRNRAIGFVFQFFNLLPMLNAGENVTLPLSIAGEKPDREWYDDLIRSVGLGDRLSHRPSELSGGQQQRVAIARALVHEPSLLICDEPTSALDKDTGAQIMQMVRDLSRSPERCVVVVTHDHRIFRFADRIAEMEDGRIRRVVEDASLLDTNHL